MAQYDFPTSKLGDNGTQYYAMGGVTVEFMPIVGGSSSGVWANLGPVVNASMNPNFEIYEHYDARPGTRVKDLKVVTDKSLAFTVTSEEFNPFVFSALTMASGYAQSGTTQTVTDESVTFDANNFGALQHTPLATPAPVVTDTSGATTYTAGTDYEILVAPDGKTYLWRDPDGTIPANATVLVDYSYDDGTGTTYAALVADEITGQVRITFKAGATGQNWRFYHTKASLRPTGNISLNVTEVSTAEFEIEVLYDASATVTVAGTPHPAPFGYFDYGITL